MMGAFTLLLLLTFVVTSCDAFFFSWRRCRSDSTVERCGFFRVATVRHFGTPGTADCVEYCIFFESPELECGGCGDIEPQESFTPMNTPSPTQVPTPSPAPITAPSAEVPPPSVDTPVSAPILDAPVSIPEVPVAAPVPVQVTVPAPFPVPTKNPTTLPTKTPVSASTKAPTFPAPVPVPILTKVPSKNPTKLPTNAPVSASTKAPTVPGNFNIDLDLVGVSASDRTFFTDAKSRWESIIRGDLQDIPITGADPPSAGCAYPTTMVVDDLYICAQFVAIDGPGRILGSAGPIYIRRIDGLTITGEMEFDSADIEGLKSQGNVGTVILHEIGHILGIGTLWEDQRVTGPQTSSCPYNGPRANAEYKTITGCDVAPTENSGRIGDGTFCGHWDEDCMRSELMTGFLNGGLNPLSRITIATLDDIGYSVDYTPAESYGRDAVTSTCRCGQRSLYDSTKLITTHQLGARHNSTRRRSLSEEAYQEAVDHGLATLIKRQLPSKSFSFLDNFARIRDDFVYIGDQVVVVFVEEDGVFFDVTVTL